MITQRIGDIFDQKDLHVIAHQANCYHTFGSGIAAAMYEADCTQTKKGDLSKLGTYSMSAINRPEYPSLKYGVNLYGQGGFGLRAQGDRDTSYDALYNALAALRKDIDKLNYPGDNVINIGLPYLMSCGLGGGSWNIVYAIIQHIFEKHENINIVICKLPSMK